MSINHKRVKRIMRENATKSKVAKKFNATRNSNHKLPVAENILNRDFSVDKRNEKMVSNISMDKIRIALYIRGYGFVWAKAYRFDDKGFNNQYVKGCLSTIR